MLHGWMRRIKLTFLLLITFFNILWASDEGIPIIKNFESHDYQGGSRVYSIVSTSNGLLYAGDKSGVLVYDGESWSKIQCGFPVMSLAVDSNDVVYLAGTKGIGYLNSDSSNVLQYTPLDHLVTTEGGIKNSRLSKVFNIDDNIVYVLGHEILINTAERVRIIESPHLFIYHQEVNGELYLFSNDDGVFSLRNGKIELISNDSTIIRKDIKGFVKNDGELYFIDNDKGIVKVGDHQASDKFDELNSFIRMKNISSTKQIDDSTYVLETFYNGIALFNKKGKFIKSYNYNNGLINNTAFTSYEDHWGNLWVGTAKGISSIRLNFPFTIYNNWEGIGTGYASIRHKGEIYLATSQGLYKRVFDEKGVIEYHKLFSDHVWSLHEIEGKLYFGQASGIYVLDNEKISKVVSMPGGWSIKKIPKMEGRYLASSPVGLLRLDLNKQNVLVFKGVLSGLDRPIRNFEFDKQAYVWAEFNKGICKFKLDDEVSSVTDLRLYDRVESGNKLKKVRKIESEVLLIADKGIYRFDDDLEFVIVSMFDKFISRNGSISNMIYDEYGKLWLFTGEELYRYMIVDQQLIQIHPRGFDFANKSYPLDFENIYYINEDLVLMGQEQGFLCCNLPLSKARTYSAVVIRKIQIKSRKGEVKDIWGDESFKEFQQRLLLEDNLAYTNNSIKLYFSSGSSNYGNIRYSTYLIGYDEYWSDWTDENIKEYTNLPPGEYTFVVRSVNKSNEYSYAASCKFIVKPPLYLTNTARAIYVVFIILLVFGVERLIRIRAKKVQRELLQKQEEKQFRKNQTQIQENLKKEKEIVKLKNEKLRVDNLYKSKELANSTMNIINNNQFLIDLKTELQKIQELSENNKIVTDDVQKLIWKVNRGIESEENWKVFEDYFDSVHENFFEKMKQEYPILTTKDLRLCAYLRMNLSTKEIAPLMNISVRGVEIGRYRLRKKLGLGRLDNLNDFLFKV